jgi:hypothetical protein
VGLNQLREETPMHKLRSNLTYANVMVTLLAFIVLAGGAAYAADTVFSTDIVDGEVKNPDIATNAVRSAQLQNGEVLTADIGPEAVVGTRLSADAVGGPKVADDSLTGADIHNDALTGDDIDEMTLQDIGGGSGRNNFTPNCPIVFSPECAQLTITLRRTGRVLISASGVLEQPGPGRIECWITSYDRRVIQSHMISTEDLDTVSRTIVSDRIQVPGPPEELDLAFECVGSGNSPVVSDAALGAVVLGDG